MPSQPVAAVALFACLAVPAGLDRPAAATAQEAPLALTRLGGPIVLDGMPDEPAWQAAPPLELTMYAPTFRGTPTQRTEIRVAYDDHAFYAAGWFWDEDPGGVRINSLYRDRWNGDDAFAIYIDPFNDNRNAKWFGTTPAGMRFDQLVSDDGAVLNGSWDAFWQAATRVTEEGWFAEVRIPFSTLGFQTDAGRTVMGLTLTRLVSRLNERVTFPAIDPRFQFRQPSVAQDVVLEDIRGTRPLYVTPYALTGLRQQPVLAPAAGRFETEADVPGEVGLDLRFAPSGDWNLDLTANTDFAQVEADDEQVALDRFPLFYPEKRRFFQERSEIFDFTGGLGTRLFHSRRIGLTAEHAPVPVLGGARLVGRVGEWDVGVLDMQTEAVGGLASENFGVARIRRGVLNPYSALGAMLTSRVGGGAHNLGAGVDADLRVHGSHYLALRWAGTFDDDDGPSTAFADRSFLDARWSRRVQDGLAFDLQLTRAGPAFRPELGFLPRADFTRASVVSNWFHVTDEHPWLRRVWPGMLAFSTWRNRDGSQESGTYAVWVQWETKAGGGGWIEPKLFVEDVRVPFTVGDATIPAGRHTFADLQLVWSMPLGRRLRTDVDFRAGTFFDGTRVQAIAAPTWNLSRHLELGADYQYSRLRFGGRGERADVHVGRLRVRTALDARASGNAFVQYNSTTDRLGLNVRLRYNFAEGTDLWLVYDEALDTEREALLGLPRSPLSTSRALMLKYTYTFAL